MIQLGTAQVETFFHVPLRLAGVSRSFEHDLDSDARSPYKSKQKSTLNIKYYQKLMKH